MELKLKFALAEKDLIKVFESHLYGIETFVGYFNFDIKVVISNFEPPKFRKVKPPRIGKVKSPTKK